MGRVLMGCSACGIQWGTKGLASVLLELRGRTKLLQLLLEGVPWKNLLPNLCQDSQKGIRAMRRTGAEWGGFRVMGKIKTGLELLISTAVLVLLHPPGSADTSQRPGKGGRDGSP